MRTYRDFTILSRIPSRAGASVLVEGRRGAVTPVQTGPRGLSADVHYLVAVLAPVVLVADASEGGVGAVPVDAGLRGDTDITVLPQPSCRTPEIFI